MTVVEKAAYLKGLTEGLGIAPDSKEGKLWNALNELLSDMAHEIEDLHACYDEHDATCPVCGEEISFDEDTLAEGSIECPNCGEKLEFDLGDDDKDEDKE